MEATNEYNEKMEVIFNMIENSRAQIKDNAFFYLLWGWLVLIASLSNFIMQQMEIYQSYIVWPVLMSLGGIISVIAGVRQGKKNRHRTHIDTAIIYLWWGFLFSLIIVLVSAISGFIPWNIADALIISLYALGTFVSGGILKFRPLVIGGVISWVIAVVAFFVSPVYVLLLVALSIIIAYLIPGYLLKSAR